MFSSLVLPLPLETRKMRENLSLGSSIQDLIQGSLYFVQVFSLPDKLFLLFAHAKLFIELPN